MEIANGTVILSPENHQLKHGITPAEALILYAMHRTNANGNPLGDFYIQPGNAVTVDTEGKPAEEEYYNQHTGKTVAAKPAVVAVTHKRTQQEEILRLKRKYTGNIKVNGQDTPAFIAVFGNAITVSLPETFEEIQERTGHIFHPAGSEPKVDNSDTAIRRRALLAMKRADLCALAVDEYRLKVKVADSDQDIADAIIEAEEARAAKKAAETAEAA